MTALALIVGLAIVIGAPLVSIFAVNQLFGLAIEFTFPNWFAALWLTILFAAKGGGIK